MTAGVTTTQFEYNGDGARLKQVVNGAVTTYTLDPSAGSGQALAAPLVQVLMMPDAEGRTAYLYGVTQVDEQQSTIPLRFAPGTIVNTPRTVAFSQVPLSIVSVSS